MEPKKNPNARLEGKSSLFFLVGATLSLLMVIAIIQYERAYSTPVLESPVTASIDDDPTPITIRVVDKPKVEKKIEPKMVDPNKLVVTIKDPVIELPTDWIDTPDDEMPEVIGFDEEEAEVFEFVRIENIARPILCEKHGSKDLQMRCFNSWIKTFIAENTNYPAKAAAIGLEGTVYVSFVISDYGMVEKVKIEKGEYPLLNEEAKRVISSMPKMIPGRQGGKKVKMSMVVPVKFKLS